jgi:rhodanese-related sulfurtransferase
MVVIAMNSPDLSPAAFRAHLESTSSRLIDVREPIEFSTAHVPGAESIPLGTLDSVSETWSKEKPLAVMCQRGARGSKAQAALAARGFTNVVNLEGGLEAWQSAGFPVNQSHRKHLPLMQQVQLTIGLGVLAGALLAVFVDARFAFICAFFGAGMILSGSTGWCGLALLMAKMPWNRTP